MVRRKTSKSTRSVRRYATFEQLERRELLATAIWHNLTFPVDVNGDQSPSVDPLDVLTLINEINAPKYSDPITRSLPRQLSHSQRTPYLDPDCDGSVSPLDVLMVVNYINAFGSGGGGRSPTSGGTYANSACSPQLSEGTDFATELTRVLHVPSENKILRVQFEAPIFDTLSQQQIRDAFEIEITDSNGRPMVLPYAPDRSASFNWSERSEPAFGTGTWSTAHMPEQTPGVSFDLSDVATGTELQVTARLVNNDSDSNTNVLIRGYEFVNLPTGTPGSSRTSTLDPSATRSSPIELSRLSDVSGSILAEYGRTSLSGDNNELLTELQLSNIGAQAVLAPLIVVLEQFSDLEANAMRPDGILSDGRPFFDLTSQLVGQTLPSGESVRSREIRFLNESGQRFSYALKVYGKLNTVPSPFSTVPITAIEAGKTYRYEAVAADPDEQDITYSITVGPDAMEVDSVTGIVRWNTLASDVGTQRVTLRATDPYGLFVEQTFDLSVVASLQNRPPIFVTDPVTEAIASSGFEITTVATGSQPAGVDIISGFRGPRLVTINAGDQTVGVHAGENNDRFDDNTFYSTGEPKSTGAAIDVGYAVDVGLPPFLVPADRNEVLGMDQGDLNGDGVLDLVVLTVRNESTKPQGQRDTIAVTRMLGDGDGRFSVPQVIATIPFTSTAQAKHLRVANVDGDEYMDVIAIEETSSRLLVVRGLGNGEFQPAVLTTLDVALNDYRLFDLDSDGHLDIVGRDENVSQLGWMRNAEDGTFEPFVRLADGGGISVGVGNFNVRPYDFADLNGDGHMDIVHGEYNSGKVVVLLNDGQQNFGVALAIDPPGGNAGPFVVHLADLTGDGELDLFTVNQSQSRVDLFVGDGSATGFTHQPGVGVLNWSGNAVGSDGPVDVNGDGYLDIVLANAGASGPISPQVLINDGQGNFTRSDYPMVDFPGHILANQLTNRSTARGAMFGDYNRDGVIDFAYMTSDYGGYDFNGVGIRLGTRPGEFGSTRTISDMTLNRNDNEVHAADFNGDGAIDLLTLSNARMSLGNGDGTFQPSFPAASIAGGSDSGVVADFNLDGILDYVATRGFGNGFPKIYVALGNGDGTFDATLGPIAPGIFYNYNDIRQVDFNNDGYPDLIAKAGVERFIDVYLNDPANPGTFTQSFRTVITVTGNNARGYTSAFATGDFDGDGNIDFVAVDQLPGEPQKLVTFSGDGAGNFAITDESYTFDDAMFQIAFYYPGVLQSGDVNGDGLLDTVSFGWHGAIVHIGNGDGTFRSNGHYPLEYTNSEAVDSYLIDFDQDGHLDMVHYAPDETLSIRVGKGDGTFGEPQRFGTMGRGDALTFADIDNDGHLDIAMVMTQAGNYQNEDVVFYYGTRNDLVDQFVVDLDGDGNEEILAVNEANDRLKILVGDNLGRMNRQTDLLAGPAPQAVATGDLNGDGQLEIITANRAGRSISVFNGSLASGYTSQEVSVGSAPIDVLARDINGDGHADVLVLDEFANALWVLSGTESGALADPRAIALGDKPGRFTVADATGDGQLDAIITLPKSNRLMILQDWSVQPSRLPIYLSLSDSPSDIQVTDLNGDGNPDLAATVPGSNVLGVLYGRGNNQFARAQNISVGDKPTRVILADADEDGRMDLIVANSGDNTASVIYNRFDPNEVYRYDPDAIDPDDDPITYSIVDGPGGLIINSQTGALLWAASPDQVGEHSVTISADDGRGGIATQSFKVDVQPARDNAAPLIATEPNTSIGAGEIFSYQATALDNDSDTLRYSLIDAPAGATIDPTTGKVTWDARADMALHFAPHGIASTGRVEIEANPSLQPTSLTAEGWYNFTTLPASNGRTNLIYQAGTSNQTAYALYNFGNAFLRLELDYPSPTHRFTYSIPYVPTANRWTHFAITIDDSTLTAKIFVDGVERGSTTLPGPIGYNSATNAQVGDSSVFFTRAIIDNYRLWNVVRTPAEIAEGLSRHYDGDTRLVLDYRFDEPRTLTVRDYSPAGNDGYRRANGLMPVFVPGLAETGSHPFTIGVEDGRGGYDQQSFTLDVLPELRGSIRGQAFIDLDGSGSRDASSESVMSDVHLFIDINDNGYPDPSEPQTTTDANGNYQFTGLLPGQYPVVVSSIAGFETPSLQSASVTANHASQVDMAIEQLMLSQIRGQLRTEQADPIAYWKVYADLDLDGELDDDEPVSISDRSGNFAITGLNPGDYTIRAELPAGWSVASGANGQDVTLAADAVSEGNHFTLEPTNTSVTGGLHFVTMPSLAIEARQTFRYASVAMGILHESITYDLSLAPDGLSIDPATGLIAWRPTIAQVGEHLLIVRATGASGSIALHDFTLDVISPNTAPTLITEFPGTAYVGLIYAIDLAAQDAESQSISYNLISGPSSATLNATTGELRWIPTLADVGNVAFSIHLRDSTVGVNSVNATVAVVNSQPSATPFSVTLPRTQVGLGQDYFARVEGSDALGRPLIWSLVTGPSDLLVRGNGRLTWTPGSDDVGSHSIVLQAANVDGTTADYSFTLQVFGRPVNATPSVTSTPIVSTTLGKEYQYAVEVLDSDADPLSFALVNAPLGMSIHPSLGRIRWMPAADQLAESDVSVQVTDPDGATATQEFKIKVSKSGGPPSIASIPRTEASVGIGYLYSIVARDVEGDPLTFRLIEAPAGMVIAETTGVISWTPQLGQTGQQDVVIEVSDGIGGAVTQAFSIRVSAGAPNSPPVIRSTAPRFGAVGSPYSYTLQATDPESTTIVYSLGNAPAGMTINASSGEVAWTPTAGQSGKFVVTLIATDAAGAKTVESFELDVLAANSQPTIISTAPAATPAGAVFTYQVLGRDADLDQLTYALTTAPAGATIDSFGKISWTSPPALIGSHDFAVRVSDPRGGVATQSFTLNVIEDLEPPKVSIIESLGDANRNILPWQGPFVVYVRAIDNVAIRSLTLQANGQDIPLDAAGTATITFEDWRFQAINATATAIDTNGNITSKTITFDYDFPEGWSGAGTEDTPTVAINSPTDAAAVFGMVTISGTASHDDFAGYKLSYRRIDETTYTAFHESTAAVVNGELGVWDTSLLINDEYIIRLEAASNSGIVNVVEHNVGLSGDLKLGNFQLSFTDMVIPVAGIPIEITRIYDTLQADREGDFGYGWRLEYRNTDLRVGLPKSGLEDIGIYTPLRPGVKVYLNVPGQGRQGFTFNPDIRVLPGFGGANNLALARPRFLPDPGVTSTLSTGTSNYLLVNEQGELFAPGGIPYNPASPDFGGAYVLTTRSGIEYRIDGSTGLLSSAIDLNGNKISFSSTGITNNNGLQGIEMLRDSLGRVQSVKDPAGNSVVYKYSTFGDLVEVLDREGNATHFEYSTTSAHFLQNVIDPLGRIGTRVEYGTDGRLSRFGGRSTQSLLSFDLQNLRASVVESEGKNASVAFNAFGRPILVVNALGNTNEYVYDSEQRLVKSRNALGETTIYEYTANGDIASKTNSLRQRDTFTYDAFGNLMSSTNTLGHTKRFAYDRRGNLVSAIDAIGNREVYAINNAGLVVRTTNQLGAVTQQEYDPSGRPTRIIDPMGGVLQYGYDPNGNLIEQRDSTGITRFTFNKNDVAVSQIGADGAVTQRILDASGTLSATIDGLGRRIDYVFTAAGDLEKQTFQDGTSHQILRDSSGHLKQLRSRTGATVEILTDALGNPASATTPDDTPGNSGDNAVRQFTTDPLERLTSVTDSSGQRIEFRYENGFTREAQTIDALGRITASRYDAVGNLTERKSGNTRQLNYSYDPNGNRTLAASEDGRSLSEVYDAGGRVIETKDSFGQITRYERDLNGRITAVIDPAGRRIEYLYDTRPFPIGYRDQLGVETLYQFDSGGRLSRITHQSGANSSYEYDLVGRLTGSVDPDGTSTQYQYDSNDRISIIQPSNTSAIQIVNNTDGLPTSVTDSRGQTSYLYDVLNRLVTRTEPDGRFVTYSYDSSGNIKSITTPFGTTRYTYSLRNLMTSVTDSSMQTTTYEYDVEGRRSKTTFWNGVVENRNFDARGWLASIVQKSPGGTVLYSYSYVRDSGGRIVRVTEHTGRSTSYEYDIMGRLLWERIGDPVSGARTIGYGYDSAGNRILRTDSLEGTTEYEFNSNGQVFKERRGSIETSYSYDLSGNLVSRFSSADNQDQLEWNFQGRLTRVRSIRPDGITVVEYEYDYLGNRVSRSENGVKTMYLIDSNREHYQVLSEYRSSGQNSTYTYGLERISKLAGSIKSLYLHDDHSGTRALINNQASSVSSYSYDAFGNLLASTGGNHENYALFRGEFRDPVTGFDNLRARNYDPATGRFISRDRVGVTYGDLVNFSRYQYVGADPVNRSDPSGELWSLMEALFVNSKTTALQQAQFKSAIVTLEFVGAALGGFVSFKEVQRRLGEKKPTRQWKGELARFSASVLLGVEIGAAEIISGLVGGHYAVLGFSIGASLDIGFGADNVVLDVPKYKKYGSGDLKGLYLRGLGGGVAFGTSIGLGSLSMGRGDGYLYSKPSTDVSGQGVFGIPKAANLGGGVDFLAAGWVWMMSPEINEEEK